jgi:predicted acyltransferase (DUF342 family)
VTVAGAVSLASTLSVGGASNFASTVTVVGAGTFKSNVSVSGNVDIAGNVSVGGTLFAAGGITYDGDVSVSGNLAVGGNVSVGGTLSVTGAVSLASSLSVGGATNLLGTVTATGNAGFLGTVRVSGATSLENALNVTGAALFSSTVTVVGATHLQSTVSVAGNTQLSGTLTVGVNDTGHDVKFFGATDGSYMLWDESTDDLILGGDSKMGIGTTSPAKKFTLDGSSLATIGTLTDGATITPNFDTNQNFSVTLGGNRTLANPSNIDAGQTGSIFVVQDGTGSRTLSFGSYWKFAGGTPPTLSTAAGSVDRIDYIVYTATAIHAVATFNIS